MGPVRPRRPSLPGAPSAPLGPGSPWVRKMMVGYLGRSLPGVHPPRLSWFFTPQEGLGPSSSSSRAAGQSWAQLVRRDCPQGPHCWAQRWHRASPPGGAAAPPWLTGAHPAPRGRCGETGGPGAEQRQDFGDTHSVTLGAWQAGSTAFSGHSLQTGGALTPGGTGSTSIALDRSRHRKWVLVKPCVPVTAPSPSQHRPHHSTVPITETSLPLRRQEPIPWDVPQPRG